MGFESKFADFGAKLDAEFQHQKSMIDPCAVQINEQNNKLAEISSLLEQIVRIIRS